MPLARSTDLFWLASLALIDAGSRYSAYRGYCADTIQATQAKPLCTAGCSAGTWSKTSQVIAGITAFQGHCALACTLQEPAAQDGTLLRSVLDGVA